jgi:hypothetical protein
MRTTSQIRRIKSAATISSAGSAGAAGAAGAGGRLSRASVGKSQASSSMASEYPAYNQLMFKESNGPLPIRLSAAADA